MLLLALSCGLLVFSLVVLLFSRSGIKKDTLAERLEGIKDLGRGRTGRVSMVNEELKKPFLQRLVPFLKSIMSAIGQRLPQMKSPKLTEDLRRAGSSMRTEEYSALRLILALGFGGLGYFIGFRLHVAFFYQLLIAIYGIALVFIIMRFLLKSAITSRREKMLRQLPEILDLLSVSVDAGLSFDASLLHVAARLTGPLVFEFKIMQREIAMGRSKRDALTNLSDRCTLEEVSSFSNAIIQSEQLGIPLKNVLKAQSSSIRQQHRQRIEEMAMKAPVKLVFPLVLFVLPVLFIVLLGPSILNAMNTFKQ